MKYEMVYWDRFDELYKINQRLKEGWKLYGNPVAHERGNYSGFAQAIILGDFEDE